MVISQLIYPVRMDPLRRLIFLIVLPFAYSAVPTSSLTWLFVRAALVLSPLNACVALMIYALQASTASSGARASNPCCAPSRFSARRGNTSRCRGWPRARSAHQRRRERD